MTDLHVFRVGIDVGSTTAKIVVVDAAGKTVFTRYERHNAKARETVCGFLSELSGQEGDARISVCITGSVGMGISEKCSLPFVQEVVAATKAIKTDYPQVSTMIDIGGEDAKVVFFDSGTVSDLRMNGNCAGGTGAFIDQMAIILDEPVERLGELALKAERIYPVASRCGVFCKTDIQNLVSRNAGREDIAASIFHAVTLQTVVTLAHGRDIKPPVLMCGGPLTFIPALRNSFRNYLSLKDEDMILPEDGSLMTAYGAALSAGDVQSSGAVPGTAPVTSGGKAEGVMRISELVRIMDQRLVSGRIVSSGLAPLFRDAEEYGRWKKAKSGARIVPARLGPGAHDVFLGIDSGSTTTKIVVTDTDSGVLFSYYCPNGGNPVKAVETGLRKFLDKCGEAGAEANVIGSCSTGYGEDLIRAAFRLDAGIVETMAHYRAASYMDPQVSFILDIGGQDMKAIFVNNGVIDRIEINEACSSGCGSFIETFARSLGYGVSEFAAAACRSKAPCDLGTRCTVFMNSKVKQVLREGAEIEDIAAGLSYSVIRNCLYKVLKLKNVSELGNHVTVQGGMMRNDAVVKALENLAGCTVMRYDHPELMGAFGCALYAREAYMSGAVSRSGHVSVESMLGKAEYQIRTLNCGGCENRCLVNRYRFAGGKDYFSGNRCEKVFTNGDPGRLPGLDIYSRKYSLLFDRECTVSSAGLTVGIPRVLNMYEEYPFWHALFSSCGIRVVLSSASSGKAYERSARMVMSDNICFPAKIVHSHIRELQDKGVDRIFMPFVVYERSGKEQNSYNCPIVTGYSEVVRSVQSEIPVDSPVISFKDRETMHEQCTAFLKGYGVDPRVAAKALEAAEKAQREYEAGVEAADREILADARKKGILTILLIGRPYHTDPLIQHKVAGMVAEMGVNVISDDIVRGMDIPLDDVHFLSQWAYTNRILKAAKWGAMQPGDVQCVQLTSFGCGPDAFLTDAVRDMMMRHGKPMTLLKLDDIDNAGSMKLRVRSLIESLRLSGTGAGKWQGFRSVPVFRAEDRRRKILAPFFTPFISPLIPAVMHLAGYDVENLPMSDPESGEWGLKYANNEVCYPATLIVGDIIKAYKSGKYDPGNTAVAITQTGGQCRASNYISLIKKALVDAGYGEVPVISVSFGAGIRNYQPGFKVNWAKITVPALYAILYSDCIAKFYYPSVVREKVRGEADRLKDKYLRLADQAIRQGKDYAGALTGLLKSAAVEFNAVCQDRETSKVGVVGEIFLKFNPYAHKNVTGWLVGQGIEIVPPVLTDFFMQYFVNRKTKKLTRLEKSRIPEFVFSGLYKFLMDKIEKVNAVCSAFRYYRPFPDIFHEAEQARRVVSLNALFGEGWLLPAEILSYYAGGVKNVVSLQPFGCIANHIVEKGIENKLKRMCPGLNLLSLDFDSGVSDVNVTNRMMLFVDNIKMDDYADAE